MHDFFSFFSVGDHEITEDLPEGKAFEVTTTRVRSGIKMSQDQKDESVINATESSSTQVSVNFGETGIERSLRVCLSFS